MEKDLLKIISHYGINNQLKKINEEFYELTEAIINYQNDYYYMAEAEQLEFAKSHIVEEIADVEVMLLQFKEYYHIDGKEIMRLERENQKLKEEIEGNKRVEEYSKVLILTLQDRINKAIGQIETHKRKDEFLELNEWGTRELLEILKGDK